VRHNNTLVYALTSTCPLCRGLLRLRHRRDGQGSFLGCSQYPTCRFTAEYEPILNDLARRLHAAEARAHVPALFSDSLDRALRNLLGLIHPDRWKDHPLATELAKAVVDLRARAREGRL
jgi:ssDNA-binding Zn-finger/Zn-ribbon topoisomerase 1